MEPFGFRKQGYPDSFETYGLVSSLFQCAVSFGYDCIHSLAGLDKIRRSFQSLRGSYPWWHSGRAHRFWVGNNSTGVYELAMRTCLALSLGLF